MKKTWILLVLLVIGSEPAHAFTLGSSVNSNLQGWRRQELRFKVNYSNCSSISRDDLNSAILTAFSAWNSVQTSGLKLSIGEETTVSVSTVINGTSSTVTDGPFIFCDTSFGTTFSVNPNAVGGIGTFQSNVENRIDYGYLALNTQAGASAALGNTSHIVRSILIAHEIGHVIGLGHTAEEAAIMYYSTGSKQSLRLHQDDMDGISYLYPRFEIGEDELFGCGTILGRNGGGGSGPRSFAAALNFAAWLGLIGLATLGIRRFPRSARGVRWTSTL